MGGFLVFYGALLHTTFPVQELMRFTTILRGVIRFFPVVNFCAGFG